MNAIEGEKNTFDQAANDDIMQLRVESAVQKHLDGEENAALTAYESLLKDGCLSPVVFTNLASLYIGQKRYELALKILHEAIQHHPQHVDALLKLGCSLELYTDDGLDEAITMYKRVQSLEPENNQINFVLGNALVKKQDLDGAIACFEHALTHGTVNLEVAHFNLGNLLMSKNRYDRAAEHFKAALDLNPELVGSLCKYWHMRMKMCDWQDFELMTAEITRAVMQLDENTSLDVTTAIAPFSLINVVDDPKVFLKTARVYNKVTTSEVRDISGLVEQARQRQAQSREANPDQPIKIAFLSADFYNHATAYLMGELFELIDNTRFSVHVFSFGKSDPSSIMRQRIEHATDYFHDVTHKTDTEIAILIAALGIDIAVDLKGYTAQCRPGILAHRPAPIQVNYLGYPGTMGADHIDYLIADEFIIPAEHQQFYTEKIAYLPDTYQVNDSKRVVHEHQPSRQECGLPEDAFVFCCFNQSYKFTPEIFAVWMNLLKETNNSVLWLFESNEWATANLRKEAENHGVDPVRIYFAPHRTVDEHLARAKNADLFLDNFPCNAHTTASDALWIGLPLLTLSGNSFASRVAGSVLRAIGMDELITESIEEYQASALRIARDHDYYRKIKEKLISNRDSTALFDTKHYTDHLQTLFEMMQNKNLKGEAPEHIYLVQRETDKVHGAELPAMNQPMHITQEPEGNDTSAAQQEALNINVTIIHPKDYIHSAAFIEVAECLHHSLNDLGFASHLTENTMIEDGINIILGANLLSPDDLKMIPPSSIIYNFEQLTNSSRWMTTTFFESFLTHPVWDYSQRNIQVLKENGIDATHVPIGYHPCLTRLPKAFIEDIDVLFYGGMSERRRVIIDQLRERGLKVQVLADIYGKERDEVISRSKVIINIHFYDSNIFELVRVSYLLANKKAVVTECSEDTEICDDLKQAVAAVPYHELVDQCVALVNSDDDRHALEERGHTIFQQHMSVDFLTNAFAKLTNDASTETPYQDDVATDTNVTEKEEDAYPPIPVQLNMGSGKDYLDGYLNVDIVEHCHPDALVDFSHPDLIGKIVVSPTYGVIQFQKEQFDHIVANDVLEHIPDLTTTMTNCLNLLKDGGEFHITVPYDLSYGAWQDPTHVRAFNERSWLYYTDWYWYLNWTESRFDLSKLDFNLSEIGIKLQQQGMSNEQILIQARAVDSMSLTLTKRQLTETEKQAGLDRMRGKEGVRN